jgi:hypothetical protein
MSGTLALDIETVSPDREPTEQAHFRDSSYFELLAVGLGYRPGPGEPVETTVCFRDGEDAESELALVDAVCDWCVERPADRLVTYNGDGFDLLHLPGRAAVAGDAVGDTGPRDRLDRILDLQHVDLMDETRRVYGGFRGLEQVCEDLAVDVPETHWAGYEHGMNPDDWRPLGKRGKKQVVNTDVPQFGERYLALAAVDAHETVTFRALSDLLRDYTVADIEPLFELLDRRPFDGD